MGPAGDEIDCPQAEVPQGLEWVWRAWWRLSDGRNWLSGMSAAIPLPITFVAITHWADHYGYDEEMVSILDVCCKAMDEVFIQHMQQKSQK